ncbi:MAG: M13 family peptidase [Chitinophagia bacterium]|nr:M13 family peptidase [Chitinophagia bacterium]
MKQYISLMLIAGVVLFSCKPSSDTSSAAFDKTGMDTTIHPGDNFFRYANGNWLKTTQIPEDQSGWGSFFTLYDNNLKKLRVILDDVASQSNAKGSAAQKVGDFYASGMDTIAIEKKGFEPIQSVLAKIAAVKNYSELVQLMGSEMKQANSDFSLIGYYVAADEKNSSRNMLILVQTGLSLPEKSYYTKTDSITKNIRDQFVKNIVRYFVLTGTDSALATKKANEILALETKIAATHLSPVELRDPIRNYNKMSVTALQQLSPQFNWPALLATMEIKADSVNVSQPNYYAAVSKLLASEPIEVWKQKAAYDYISNNAGYLSKSFRDARFEFGKVFSGLTVQPPRWKTMVQRTDEGLQDLLGQLYVEKYFPPAAKKRMDELVNNLQIAFRKRIQGLEWMSDTTKAAAQNKLSAFIKKIGYPEKWKSYDDVTIQRDNFFGNMQSIRQHDLAENLKKIGKPVDKTEWGMTAPTVNAYYNPTFNEIVFPAGILQSPFFSAEADDAINYGAIGLVIGHEMTHGFDDQGRQYDADGNLKDWWQPSDGTKFTQKAQGVVQQYNGYKVLDSLPVNGQLTLGENLADIGGLAIAWDAFQLTEQAKAGKLVDGFTPAQRFFLGFAQAWRIKNRPENVRTGIAVDPHSPEEFRVLGPLSNFDPFYSTFGVTEKNAMFKKPVDRAKIW